MTVDKLIENYNWFIGCMERFIKMGDRTMHPEFYKGVIYGLQNAIEWTKELNTLEK